MGERKEYSDDLGSQNAPCWLPFWSPFWVRLQKLKMSSRRDGNPPEALRADPFGSLFGSLFQYCSKIQKKTPTSQKSAEKGVRPFDGGRCTFSCRIAPFRSLWVSVVSFGASGCSKTQNDLPNGPRDTQNRQKNKKNSLPPGDTHTETGLQKKRGISFFRYDCVCKSCRQSRFLIQ